MGISASILRSPLCPSSERLVHQQPQNHFKPQHAQLFSTNFLLSAHNHVYLIRPSLHRSTSGLRHSPSSRTKMNIFSQSTHRNPSKWQGTEAKMTALSSRRCQTVSLRFIPSCHRSIVVLHFNKRLQLF